MTENIAASDLFEQNLLTRFFLENELELSPAYLNGSKKADSDPNRYKNDILSDLFVERVLQDPYFSIHICKKIDESQVDLKKAIAYIQHIILEQYIHKGNSPQDVEKNTIKDWFQKSDDLNELKYNKLYSQILYSDNEDLKDIIDSIPTKKRKLLTRWQDRSPFSWCGTYNPDDTRLKNDSQADDYFNHLLNVTNKKYFIDFLKHIDFRDESRFLHENIIPHFRSSFNSDKRSLKSSYLAFLNFNTDILFEIKDTLFKYGFMHENDENDIAAYLKFYLDAVLLCQYSWFNSFNEKTKIDMLNSYYDEFELSIKEQNLSLFGNYSLLHELAYNEAKKLYGEKDYANSLSLLNKLITSSDNPYFNYSCVSLIADIYQEINEYDNALEYFLQAYEISKRFDETTIESENIDTSLIYGERFNRRYRKSNFSYRYNLVYIQYIELLNIAEMNCYLGNRDKANEYLELLERELQYFSIPKQIIILGYLAQFCAANQKTLRFAFLNKTIELCDRFKPGMISEIEDDIKDNIFSMLVYGENISREECAQDWISSREKYARKIIEQSDNTTSASKIRSDMIKVYSDYDYSIKNNSTPLTSIIENSGIRSINDVYCGFASTIEPHKLAKTFKSTLEKLENTEGIEDQECYYGPYNEIIEKLKFGLARCHYTAGDLQNAEDIFRHLINNAKDPEILFNSYCLLGIILIKLQDEDSGILMLEKAVDLDFHDFDIFYCIRDELSISSDVLLKVSQAIIDRVNQKNQNEDDCEKNGYLLAVKEFNEHDLTNEASHFIENGLKFQDDQLLKVYLLEEKAYIYYLDYDFESAKDIFVNALNIIEKEKINCEDSLKYGLVCASIWHKLALISAKEHDFKEAYNSIEISINILDNVKDRNESNKLKIWNKLKNIYSFFANDSLYLNKLDNQAIIETFETAEMIFFDLSSQRKHNKFDYSLALVEYGKGLETYMHDNISFKLWTYIFSKHQLPIENKYFINKNNKKKSLPPELRNVLGLEDRTISLGQWKPLMSTVFDSNLNKIKNPYTKDSYIFLKDFMNKDDWDTVTEACAIISDYRNGSAHYGKKAFKDIIPMRKEIVEQINNVIDALHSHSNPDV